MTTESEVLLEIHRILHELELDPQKTTALDSLSRTVLARPGIAFSMGLGGAMADRECKIVHLDVPITF